MEDGVLPFEEGPSAPPPRRPASAHEARLVGRLRALYGPGPPGATCGQCRRLVTRRAGNRNVFKCRLGPQSATADTDWRRRWEACGMFT
jgi:hypothetical protein